jgi:MoaA/NifB/PqqE/SkfB family radical SAM enzyme
MGLESAVRTAMLVRLTEITNRTFALPLVIFYPTGRCNSRCVSCDWWRTHGDADLTLAEIDDVVRALTRLGTEIVLFSGGEPLLRPEVFDAARLFLTGGVRLHLHTSGVLLERCAADVALHFSRVIISLDSTTEAGYHAVRGVAALTTVEKGVARLRQLAPDIPITARATLQRLNFRELPRLIDHARAMALDGISFLSADVSSSAFGREHAVNPAAMALGRTEVAEFAELVEETIASHPDDFESGFVAEAPDKLRRLPRYYAALAGLGSFPSTSCNAPYMSVVVEADGAVRPCFFHKPIGNVRDAALDLIVAQNLPAFRRTLDMARDPVCTRCVCSMKTGWRHQPWQ